MALLKSFNPFVISGKLNCLVFRQRNGKTIVSKAPNRKAPLSAAQRSNNASFKNAVIYAKTVLRDEAAKSAYAAKAKPGQTAHNVAISDFFNPPVIGEIDVTNYSGYLGGTIKIQATDDFKVVAVKVKIENPEDSLSEEGDATPEADGLWVYSATQGIAPFAGNIITVTAIDMPGHSTTRQIIVNDAILLL